MNIKRYWMAVIATYVVMSVGGVVLSTLLIEQLASWMALGRPLEELNNMMPLALAAYFLITIIFCYIYIKGREAGDIKEGAKFGAMFGVMVSAMTWITYSMLPFEMPALIADNVINIILYTIGGMVIAKVYKPQ